MTSGLYMRDEQKRRLTGEKLYDLGDMKAVRFAQMSASGTGGVSVGVFMPPRPVEDLLASSRIRWAHRLQSTFRLFYNPDKYVLSQRKLNKITSVLDTMVGLLDAAHYNYWYSDACNDFILIYSCSIYPGSESLFRNLFYNSSTSFVRLRFKNLILTYQIHAYSPTNL